MKILLLYSYNKGYLSSFFFELSAKLVESGHDVVNFSLKNDEKLFTRQGVNLIIKKKGGYATNYYHIFKTINTLKPDVVLSNFSYVNPALVFGKMFSVKKNVVWFHSLNDQMNPSFRNVFLKKLFLKLADIVVANSNLTAKELNDIYKLPLKNIRTIAFWSDISKQKVEKSDFDYINDSKTFKIGCPGRMATHKNHKVVIEALGKLKEQNILNFHLYLAGNGEERDNLLKICNQLKIHDKVTFMGHLSAEEMVAFYKNMDVVVLPSLHEAFGLVFIETISLGIPVIVSEQFGALSFLKIKKEEISQFTFNPESINELAEKLMLYISNESLPKAYFQQLYLDNFDKDVIFKEIMNVMNLK